MINVRERKRDKRSSGRKKMELRVEETGQEEKRKKDEVVTRGRVFKGQKFGQAMFCQRDKEEVRFWTFASKCNKVGTRWVLTRFY